jgi:hypothetical protein
MKDKAQNQEDDASRAKPHEERQSDLTHIGSVLGGLFQSEQMSRGEATAPARGAKGAGAKVVKRADAKTTRKAGQPNTKLAQAAVEIIARPPEKSRDEIAYLARELVQCSFPLRDPGPVPSWRRRNGNITFIIQPGIDPETGEPMGLPFGEFPRLVMPFFNKQVVATGSPVIRLGRTYNSFLRATGADPNTGRGKRGDAKRIKENFQRLAHSRMSFRYAEGTAQKGREAFLNMEVAKAGQLWWDFKNPDQGSFFDSEIILGDTLFQAFLNNPIPVDFRALLALKRSLNQASFAMDIYNWASGHLYQMRKNGEKERRIQYKYLPEQFGAVFARLRDWKAAFEENLLHVQQVLPALDYAFDGDYFILKDQQGRLAVAPSARKRLAQITDQISPKARAWFQERYPLHNVDEVFAAFDDWRRSKEIPSRNTDAHFKDFVVNSWFKR